LAEIALALVDEMIAHARAEFPNEACGVIHAADGAAATVHRVTNAAASPYRYEMAPLEQLKLEQQRDESRETLFAIYHSRVASEAKPSPTDVNMAFWPPADTTGALMYPETYYIVVSLEEALPTVRVFRIKAAEQYEDNIEEVPLEIV